MQSQGEVPPGVIPVGPSAKDTAFGPIGRGPVARGVIGSSPDDALAQAAATVPGDAGRLWVAALPHPALPATWLGVVLPKGAEVMLIDDTVEV